MNRERDPESAGQLNRQPASRANPREQVLDGSNANESDSRRDPSHHVEKESNRSSEATTEEAQWDPTTRSSMLVDMQAMSDGRWQEFVMVYGRWLRYYIQREGIPESDVDDCLQEVLMSVRAGITRFQRDPQLGSFRGWLRQIIRWRAADYFRRRPSGQARVSDTQWKSIEDPNVDSVLLSSDGDGSAAEIDDQQILRQTVAAAMHVVRGKVKPVTWEMFERRILKKEETKDIAAALGVAEANVRMAVSRVKAKLREILRDDFCDLT